MPQQLRSSSKHNYIYGKHDCNHFTEFFLSFPGNPQGESGHLELPKWPGDCPALCYLGARDTGAAAVSINHSGAVVAVMPPGRMLISTRWALRCQELQIAAAAPEIGFCWWGCLHLEAMTKPAGMLDSPECRQALWRKSAASTPNDG